MALSYREMEDILMKELRLYHHPIALTWMFSDDEVKEFAARTPHVRPVKPLTFCQWEVAARMQAKTVLGEVNDLDCLGAHMSFGWQEMRLNEKTAKYFSRHCADAAQIERFLEAKPRLPLGKLKALAVGPLGKAEVPPHVIHFYCDTMQAYHLSVDYMAATGAPALRPILTGSSAACGGSVFCWREKTFNLCPACSGNFNAGKMERGEINVFIPGEHLEALVDRLLFRISDAGSSSITRPGDPFPGADICKNCPQIVFTKEKTSPGNEARSGGAS